MIFQKIFTLYYDGFRNMKLCKVLWGIIFIKIILFFGVLKFFIFDKNLKNLYPNDQDKSTFVLQNLTKENHGSLKR